MTRSTAALLALVLVGAILLAGCAPGPNDAAGVSGPDVAGFWLGLWHGIIAPITFVISLFTDGVNVYEVRNNGNWYDFGFVLGLSLAFGSGPLARRRRR
jgi:predicted small secreted protein